MVGRRASIIFAERPCLIFAEVCTLEKSLAVIQVQNVVVAQTIRIGRTHLKSVIQYLAAVVEDLRRMNDFADRRGPILFARRNDHMQTNSYADTFFSGEALCCLLYGRHGRRVGSPSGFLLGGIFACQTAMTNVSPPY